MLQATLGRPRQRDAGPVIQSGSLGVFTRTQGSPCRLIKVRRKCCRIALQRLPILQQAQMLIGTDSQDVRLIAHLRHTTQLVIRTVNCIRQNECARQTAAMLGGRKTSEMPLSSRLCWIVCFIMLPSSRLKAQAVVCASTPSCRQSISGPWHTYIRRKNKSGANGHQKTEKTTSKLAEN